MLEYLFELAVLGGSRSKENMCRALQEAVDQALGEDKAITACAIRLLENLVSSGKHPELANTLLKAKAGQAQRASKSSYRSSGDSANSNGSQTVSQCSTPSTEESTDALTLAMKVAFFADLMDEDDLRIAALSAATDSSGA